MHASRLLVVALMAFGLSVGVAACGGDGGSEDPAPSSAEHATSSPDAPLEHIHGLGLSGGRLFIATHSGLFTVTEGDMKARRFGESRQDVMGFSVIDDERFIGSGHPAPGQDAPPNLGLIESRDGGRTWSAVSLRGEADFHTLESQGDRVYGFDGTQARLMVSSDAGRTWDERRPPAGIFSLAIDPTSPDRVVASTERGLFESKDAGKTMRPLELREQRAGLLAWPWKDKLFLIDGNGQVVRSSDGGRSWTPVGSIEGQPAAFMARDDELYAALLDGTVKRSADGGRSWSVRATP